MRWVSSDGRYDVEVVTLDGEQRIRVKDWGYVFAYFRSLDDLQRAGLFDLADLRPLPDPGRVEDGSGRIRGA